MTEKLRPIRLTQADVSRLMSDSSPQTRARTTAKIAAEFDAASLNEAERRIAEDIFRSLVKDTEVLVREALAAHLKSTPELPHDVALALARDVDSVALPMLKFSEVLTDDDLIEIVRGQEPSKQVAIAQRPGVSEAVSNALVDTGNEAAVAHLIGNEGAVLSEDALDRVIDEYNDSTSVADSLARRPNLPPAISERVVSALAERLQAYLVSKHDVSPDMASTLILQARERATVTLIDYGSSEIELESLIEQLDRKGRLTPSLLLRVLCVGDLNFFERAMSKLTDLPLPNVRILIHDKGMLGLEPLYTRAGLPKDLFPAFRAAVSLVVETEYDGGQNDRQRYVERIMQRMLTKFEDPTTRIATDDIEYLMAKLQQLAA
ncbi:MAG: DUF2336 domain-containing protein [Alphaproteobacteria bacterium]